MVRGLSETELRASWVGLLVATVCVIGAFASFGVTLSEPVSIYDEGFALTNAWRILQGQRPHVDFWASYPSGSAQILAFAFDRWGPSLIVARLVHSAWIVIFAAAFFALLRSSLNVLPASAGAAVAAVWFAVALYPGYAMAPALALIMAAVALLNFSHRLAGCTGPGALVLGSAGLAGMLAASVVTIRHDLAAYFAVSATAATVWCFLRSRSKGHKADTGQGRIWFVFLATFIPFAALGLAALFANEYRHLVFDQLIRFPAGGMREHRVLPVPNLFQPFSGSTLTWALAWSAPAISLATAAVLTAMAIRRVAWSNPVALLLGVLGILLNLQAFNRLDLSHAAPAIIISGLALVLLVNDWIAAEWHRGPVFGIVLQLGLVVAVAILTVAHILPAVGWDRLQRCVLQTSAFGCMSQKPDQQAALAFINSRLARDDSLFVGNLRHDKIFVNDVSFYFFAQRPIATRFSEMHPGIVTSAAEQDEIVAELERGPVKMIVLVDLPQSVERNRSSVSSGVCRLDLHIRQHYSEVASFGRYRVLERRLTQTETALASGGGSCP